MAANISAIELHFFDDGGSGAITLTDSPFRLQDEGFLLGNAERDIYNYTVGNYSNFFTGGFDYKERRVEIDFDILNFGHTEVIRLYRDKERMNNLYRFIEHPLCALYFRIEGNTVLKEKGGYMKVLTAEIQSTNKTFSL